MSEITENITASDLVPAAEIEEEEEEDLNEIYSTSREDNDFDAAQYWNTHDQDSLKERILYLSRNGESEELISILRKQSFLYSINLNFIDESGWTPLIHSCFNGYYDIVSEILNYQENKYKNDFISFVCRKIGYNGSTAFHLSCARGHDIIVQLLINKLNNNNKYNIKSSQLINATDYDLATPLHCAVLGKHYNICKILLNNNAKITKDIRGQTPIDWAKKQNLINIVQLLQNKHNTNDNNQSRNIVDSIWENNKETEIQKSCSPQPIHIIKNNENQSCDPQIINNNNYSVSPDDILSLNETVTTSSSDCIFLFSQSPDSQNQPQLNFNNRINPHNNQNILSPNLYGDNYCNDNNNICHLPQRQRAPRHIRYEQEQQLKYARNKCNKIQMNQLQGVNNYSPDFMNNNNNNNNNIVNEWNHQNYNNDQLWHNDPLFCNYDNNQFENQNLNQNLNQNQLMRYGSVSPKSTNNPFMNSCVPPLLISKSFDPVYYRDNNINNNNDNSVYVSSKTTNENISNFVQIEGNDNNLNQDDTSKLEKADKDTMLAVECLDVEDVKEGEQINPQKTTMESNGEEMMNDEHKEEINENETNDNKIKWKLRENELLQQIDTKQKEINELRHTLKRMRKFLDSLPISVRLNSYRNNNNNNNMNNLEEIKNNNNNDISSDFEKDKENISKINKRKNNKKNEKIYVNHSRRGGTDDLWKKKR